ncbi:hypothetical protein, partial, partial [Parasitella parasitica]
AHKAECTGGKRRKHKSKDIVPKPAVKKQQHITSTTNDTDDSDSDNEESNQSFAALGIQENKVGSADSDMDTD